MDTLLSEKNWHKVFFYIPVNHQCLKSSVQIYLDTFLIFLQSDFKLHPSHLFKIITISQTYKIAC